MLVIKLTSVFVVLTVFINNVASYGEYVPKSVYLLDSYGHKSDEYHVRNRRDLESALRRMKRHPGNGQSGNGGASSHSYSGSYSHSGNDADGSSYIPDFSNFASNIPSSFEDIKKQADHFANLHSRNGGAAPGPEDLGYKGPILFSRSGVDKGTGVKVSGAAQGPHGAFSSSSSSIDNKGNIKYDVKSGKY